MKTVHGKFYVAKCYGAYVSPAIVEAFDCEADAKLFAEIMCHNKDQAYIVLEFKKAIVPEDEMAYYRDLWKK